MKNRKRSGGNAVFLAPLYLFTVIFLIGPFVSIMPKYSSRFTSALSGAR